MACVRQAQFGGEGGIRTLGTLLAYGSLANYWFRPLTHLSRVVIIKSTKVKKLLRKQRPICTQFNLLQNQ